MTTTIFFDMDGTIADLYGVENWLDYLIASDALPYEIAKPLIRLNALARILNRLQKQGYKVGVISWLAKNSNTDYDEKACHRLGDDCGGGHSCHIPVELDYKYKV